MITRWIRKTGSLLRIGFEFEKYCDRLKCQEYNAVKKAAMDTNVEMMLRIIVTPCNFLYKKSLLHPPFARCIRPIAVITYPFPKGSIRLWSSRYFVARSTANPISPVAVGRSVLGYPSPKDSNRVSMKKNSPYFSPNNLNRSLSFVFIQC